MTKLIFKYCVMLLASMVIWAFTAGQANLVAIGNMSVILAASALYGILHFAMLRYWHSLPQAVSDSWFTTGLFSVAISCGYVVSWLNHGIIDSMLYFYIAVLAFGLCVWGVVYLFRYDKQDGVEITSGVFGFIAVSVLATLVLVPTTTSGAKLVFWLCQFSQWTSSSINLAFISRAWLLQFIAFFAMVFLLKTDDFPKVGVFLAWVLYLVAMSNVGVFFASCWLTLAQGSPVHGLLVLPINLVALFFSSAWAIVGIGLDTIELRGRNTLIAIAVAILAFIMMLQVSRNYIPLPNKSPVRQKVFSVPEHTKFVCSFIF